MEQLRFEWDVQKAQVNRRKHRITFEEAQAVFYDEFAVEYYDPDHSDQEDRFIMLGMSAKARVLVVCHCFRHSNSVIRIISARKADKEEQQVYWRQRR